MNQSNFQKKDLSFSFKTNKKKQQTCLYVSIKCFSTFFLINQRHRHAASNIRISAARAHTWNHEFSLFVCSFSTPSPRKFNWATGLKKSGTSCWPEWPKLETAKDILVFWDKRFCPLCPHPSDIPVKVGPVFPLAKHACVDVKPQGDGSAQESIHSLYSCSRWTFKSLDRSWICVSLLRWRIIGGEWELWQEISAYFRSEAFLNMFLPYFRCVCSWKFALCLFGVVNSVFLILWIN